MEDKLGGRNSSVELCGTHGCQVQMIDLIMLNIMSSVVYREVGDLLSDKGVLNGGQVRVYSVCGKN